MKTMKDQNRNALSACDQDFGSRDSTRRQNKRDNTSEFEGKRARRRLARRKRVHEGEKSLTCDASASRESNYSSRKKRNPAKDTKHQKQCEKGNTNFTILSWLIDGKTIQENEEVFSGVRTGKIQRDGILCACCKKTFTVEGFDGHGRSHSHKPYERTCIAQTGVSLLSHVLGAWNKPDEVDCCKTNNINTESKLGDPYDDACIYCADGGELMCCEGCNSTYHPRCVGLGDFPKGSWYCPYCVCKLCADPIHEKDDNYSICLQCEKRYHSKCHEEKYGRIIDLNSIPFDQFCEHSCQEVYDNLIRNFVGKKNKLDEGYSWTLLHRMDDHFNMYIDEYLRTMCHGKLAVSRKLMEECFEPIQDRHTRIKVIPSVVYNCGANFKRIDFKGFYTAVLEKNEEIISVASIRIHGTKLAEMPFIATSEEYRRKGMCKKLMVAIESALCYLKVETLIIPSVPERKQSWIDGYKFQDIDKSIKEEVILRNTLMFHDSVRLQKTLHSSSSHDT